MEFKVNFEKMRIQLSTAIKKNPCQESNGSCFFLNFPSIFFPLYYSAGQVIHAHFTYMKSFVCDVAANSFIALLLNQNH